MSLEVVSTLVLFILRFLKGCQFWHFPPTRATLKATLESQGDAREQRAVQIPPLCKQRSWNVVQSCHWADNPEIVISEWEGGGGCEVCLIFSYTPSARVQCFFKNFGFVIVFKPTIQKLQVNTKLHIQSKIYFSAREGETTSMW